MWLEFSFRKWVLVEGINVNLLTAQYKKLFPQATPEEINAKINLAASADPTPDKKYISWIFRELINNRLRLPEDAPVALQQLSIFDKGKPALKRLGKDIDITKYDRYQLWKTLEEIGTTTSKRAEVAKVKQEGAEKLYEDGEWLLIKMTKPEACSYYAKGTKWCTSDPHTAGLYLDEGPLFMIYHNGKIYAQAHVESGQLMDPTDEPIPPGKVPEKLREIIFKYVKNYNDENEDFEGQRNKLFGIKEKVITYPNSFYWGTQDHRHFILVSPEGGDEVDLEIYGDALAVRHAEGKDLNKILEKKKKWEDAVKDYVPLKKWNDYIIDFISKEPKIKELNTLNPEWNLGDLTEDQREKLFKARPDLMPPIDLKIKNLIWSARSLGSYVLYDNWIPKLSMQLEKDDKYLNYGNWLNESTSNMLSNKELNKTDYSYATTKWLLKHNVEHAPENRVNHYNAWRFKDLKPNHQAVILKIHPDFLDDLTYHKKQSANMKELLSRLSHGSGMYNMEPYDEDNVVLSKNSNIDKSTLVSNRFMPDLFGNNAQKADIRKVLNRKIHSFDKGSISWDADRLIRNGEWDKLKEELPFLDLDLIKNIGEKDKYKVSTALSNSIGKYIIDQALKIIYNDLKPYENDKFKVVNKDGIRFITNKDNIENDYKGTHTLQNIEKEFKTWHDGIKLNHDLLVKQLENIPRGMDKEEFLKDLEGYAGNKYEFH